jgi:NitT/TauT family transport system substrate-binding protein
MAPRLLRMQLNTFLSGPQAWFFLAAERGYLAAEGLALEFVEGDTAANVVPKMAGTFDKSSGDYGHFDIGYGDINALIDHAANNRPHEPLAVFAAYNASPYTLAVSQTSGITSPLALAGKRLVTHPNDAALKLFPEFCRATGLDITSVQIEESAAPHSELVPRMLAGEWDGMFGFVNTLIAASLDAGIAAPREQIRFLEYHDHAPDLYGMALMVTRQLAHDEPEVVTRLLRALNRGLVDTVANPQAAIHALSGYCAKVGKPLSAASEASNLRRLIGTLELEMGREEGARLGIGDLDDARLQRGIQLLVDTKKLARTPKASELFNRAFLPPIEMRVRNLFTA